MRKKFLGIACLAVLVAIWGGGYSVASADVAIDEAHFPNGNFRWYVSNNFDKDHDGILSDAEIAAVTQLWVDGQYMESLQGVEYFTALTSLSCYNSYLTALDVSKNTALEELDCGYNRLTSFDVSKNTKLRLLYCDNNQLTALNVSKNKALVHLFCGINRLTTLDVTKSTKLSYLSCSNNQLTTLNVSKNTKLEYLDCGYNQLATLALTKNTALTHLSCYNNQLTALNVSKNKKLSYLSCSYNWYLRVLDVSKNTALVELLCDGLNLTVLDVSKNTKLEHLSCYGNQLTVLDVTKSTELKSLYCYNNQLTTLNVTNNTALRDLDCSNNKLTKLNVSKNTALGWLDCAGNQLTELDVTENTELVSLRCYNNKLTTLDLSNFGNSTRYYGGGSSSLLGPQNVFPLYITSTGNKTYPYQLDLSMYMSSKDIANVSSVKGLTSSDAKVTTSYKNGVALFKKYPAKVTYNYTTGYRAKTMNVTISGSPVKPSIPSKFANGVVNVKYSKSVTASGNTAPYTWSKVSGTLPTGLTLKYSDAKATLSGTPTQAGTYKFKLKVAGKNGVSYQKTFTVVIAAASSSSKTSSKGQAGSPSGMMSGNSEESTQAEQTKSGGVSSNKGTLNSLSGNSLGLLDGEDTDVSLYAELKVASDDVVELHEGKDSDLVKVRAGEPLRFTVSNWGSEVDDVIVFVDDKAVNGVEVSDDGEFTLPAEMVHDDFKVGVRARSVAGKDLESEELFIIAE